jgi:hypothetical protein
LGDGPWKQVIVEICDPSHCGPDRLVEVLHSLGQSDVDRDEFLPLTAA